MNPWSIVYSFNFEPKFEFQKKIGMTGRNFNNSDSVLVCYALYYMYHKAIINTMIVEIAIISEFIIDMHHFIN